MKIFQSRDLMSKLNVSKLPSLVLTKVLCNFFRLVLVQDHWLRVKNCSASIDVVILLTSFRINGLRLKTISTASITNAGAWWNSQAQIWSWTALLLKLPPGHLKKISICQCYWDGGCILLNPRKPFLTFWSLCNDVRILIFGYFGET